MEWDCDNCGTCCRLKECKHYSNSVCEIYENRPNECRSEWANKTYYPNMDWKEFIELSKQMCKLLREFEKRRSEHELLAIRTLQKESGIKV